MVSLNNPFFMYNFMVIGFFGVCVAFVAFAVLIWFLYIDSRIKVYLMEAFEGTFKIVATKKINAVKDTFSFKNSTYTVDLNCAILGKRNKPELFYELDNTTPVSFEKLKKRKNPKILEKVIKSSIYGKIFGAEKIDFMTVIILVCSVGALGVSLYVSYQMVDLTQNLMLIVNQLSRVTPLP